MSKASLAEKIATLENSISKLQSEIEVRRSKLKKYQSLLRELKTRNEKMDWLAKNYESYDQNSGASPLL